MNPLDILARHRNEILLAEAIGWLHDYRKCSDEQLQVQAANLSGQQALPRLELAGKYPQLTSINLQLPIQSTPRTVIDLLDGNTWNTDLIGPFLSRCHNTAHFDKQEPIGGKQNYPGTQISTVFGFETAVRANLTRDLWALPWNNLTAYNAANRSSLRTAIQPLFTAVSADTRRPINEVDLWSWGLLVGGLYKSALAGALLTGNTPAARDLHWRLLDIRVNGLDYLLNVVRIPDLLARRELLSQSLNDVRELLEVTFPIGSEVYRDENGSTYVVPDVSDLLEMTDGGGTSLRTLVLQAFEQGTVRDKPRLQLGAEIVPHLELEQHPWWGQDPGWPNSSNDVLPEVGASLSLKVARQVKTDEVRRFWQDEAVADICTVCGLRPQGPGTKAADRSVCNICEERRADRSKEWATGQSNQTIWTDEVADTNGRLALIVGKFDLAHWLDGKLLESLLLIAPHDPQKTSEPATSKTPSISRLRRIWETTRLFWQEAQEEIEQQLTDSRRRLEIYLDSPPDLGPFHIYDFALGATDLSVVWVQPQNNHDGYLLSADNLGYIARQLGAGPALFDSPAAAAIFVEDYLREQFVNSSQRPVIRNPDAGSGRNGSDLLSGRRIARVEYQENAYATVIPILTEPRIFMTLVPADRSLAVLRDIKKKYEREMGKVRDRLPLHLGIVYATRHTPIRAVLEAGRTMLDYRAVPQQWTIQAIEKQQTGAAQFGEAVSIELGNDDGQIAWRIPLKMGDGTTDDHWYPYFFLETGSDDSQADEQNRRALKMSRPGENGQTVECWAVHAGDLCVGETIHLCPSTFDFEFLDTTARRFEIHYDKNGRRPQRTRPFYLEDLDRLESLWNYMERLAQTQRHQVIRTIEATRETWYGQDYEGNSTTDEVFRQFVADTLAGATWPKRQSWKSIPAEWREKLIRAGALGELTDLAELHMEILKE